MSSIRSIHNEWRDSLVLASFRGIEFHTQTGARQSGRRLVVHEYPKRNVPYAEDMGRHAIRWTFTGYLLLRDKGILLPHRRKYNLIDQRNELIYALEADDAGTLVHPSLGTMLCMCERYAYSEQRERGGYMEFDMQFVEAGGPPQNVFINTVEQAIAMATKVEAVGSEAIDEFSER